MRLYLFLCGKMSNQILLVCLFVAFCKILSKFNKPILGLTLNFVLFLLNFFGKTQLILHFGLVATFGELSLPLLAIHIYEKSLTVHNVVSPLAFIDGSIWKLVDSLAMVVILFPLA